MRKKHVFNQLWNFSEIKKEKRIRRDSQSLLGWVLENIKVLIEVFPIMSVGGKVVNLDCGPQMVGCHETTQSWQRHILAEGTEKLSAGNLI